VPPLPTTAPSVVIDGIGIGSRPNVELVSVNPSPNAELDAARRELDELYRQLAAPRPFSLGRAGTQLQIARLKRRMAKLERERSGGG